MVPSRAEEAWNRSGSDCVVRGQRSTSAMGNGNFAKDSGCRKHFDSHHYYEQARIEK